MKDSCTWGFFPSFFFFFFLFLFFFSFSFNSAQPLMKRRRLC